MRMSILRGVAMAILTCSAAFPVFVNAADATLTVQSLSAPSATVALGAQRVPMLTLKMTASCVRDVHLASVTVYHQGLGSSRDIERVYAMSNSVRKTRSVTLSGQQGAATLRFRGLVIPACASLSIDVLADFSTTAASTGLHALSVLAASDIVSDPVETVILNPPGTPRVAMPVGQSAGAVSVEVLDLQRSLTYGSARTVARLRLKGDAQRDQAITAITFVNEGTARDLDTQNFRLQTPGHTILNDVVPALTGDRVRIELREPLIIRRNETRLLELLADIRASRRRTVEFIIQEPSDIEAAPVP